MNDTTDEVVTKLFALARAAASDTEGPARAEMVAALDRWVERKIHRALTRMLMDAGRIR